MWAVVLAVGGCATPPSVAPLLHVAQRAVREEATWQEADLVRDLEQVEADRRMLATAFEKDLQARETLDTAWVRDAVVVYTAAREELMRHEAALREARLRRADNLRTADEAVGRALWLLERQDALLEQSVGGNVWRWLLQGQPMKETTR